MKHRREVADDLKIVFAMDDTNDNIEEANKRAKTFSEKWSKVSVNQTTRFTRAQTYCSAFEVPRQ
ncbi:MAG: hypothetical protein L3J83_06110 [Proteobacteria bacterium]|nr:hypothetical protein [Pseudomonadota bacterium]